MFNDKVEELENSLKELALIMLNLKKCIILEKNKFINFQIDLAECLYDAMCVYKEISQKEREYIGKKKSLDKKEFLEKMKRYKNQKLEIREIISIGKSIGDAFAYIFYQESIEELEKHYTHSDNGLFVSGIGGRGEIEFIRANPTINGYLVVYHSITNMLRIGDFSLCTLDGRVIGTGEIKSDYIKEEQVLASSAYMISRIKLTVNQEGREGEIYGNSTKEKIQKQLEQQDILLKSDFNKRIRDKRKMNVQHYLIPMACNNKKGVAYNEDINTIILTMKKEDYDESENINEMLKEHLEVPIEKLIKDSPYNSIKLKRIGKEYKPYRKPIIWWDISDDIIMEILFDKRVIFSIVNLVTYYETLVAEGFSVEFEEKGIIVKKRCKKYDADLGNFEMIEDLIIHELYIQKDIAEMISNIVECAYNKSDGDVNVRISIKRNL